jgi:DNA-binding beta-propeller fold protein YncE
MSLSMKTPMLSVAALAALSGCGADVTDPSREESAIAARALHAPGPIGLTLLGRFSSGAPFNTAGTEITAYHAGTKRLFSTNFATNEVDVIDVSNPAAPVRVAALPAGGNPNSVAVGGDLVAVAVEDPVAVTSPGQVRLFDAATLDPGNPATLVPLADLDVGALPDMVTFTPDGTKILVANEGQPSDDYAIDPEGSVSIVDLSAGVAAASVTTARFTDDVVRRNVASIRVFGPNATPAQDFEPEYIAVSGDGSKAWVTLQENNAMAELDIAGARFTKIVGLGFKNHDAAKNAFDPSDKDGGVKIAPWPVFGMYQPDAVAAFVTGGQTYLVTANEGDARDYPGFSEEKSFRSLVSAGKVDPLVPAFAFSSDAQLGRLAVTSATGDGDGDGDLDRIYAYGARSFSIWSTDLVQVHDSGSDLERITGDLYPKNFNASNNGNSLDNRSDNKGPEPEGVAVGVIGGQTYAFIALERIGGVIVYDVTNPRAPVFVTYRNDRTCLPLAPGSDACAFSGLGPDLGPEGILFVPAASSPNGQPLLVVANEVSGTVSLYQVTGP